ncbi:MAG: cellulase family glycosylhydrolase [Bacteroidia bacterium]
MKTLRRFLPLLILLPVAFVTNAQQNFLTVKGTAIANQNGDTVILRGMGLGGWMLQEGYMLQTAGFANPQHEIRATFGEAMGMEHIDSFYHMWLHNFMTEADVDSLKAWGFNSVRLPMHYNLFTLPIEDEPVKSEQTWLKTGFDLTDSIIEWCAEREMWVVLDLHAAPGGQGGDAAISDYDPTKPSLWESDENKRKCAALWARLAKRYGDNEWVAGYDLLNEPNWELPGNVDLRKMYVECTDSIRKYDEDHIIFIEGNWWANDFTGLTPAWDDQIVYSPHKYWSYNDESTMAYATDLRRQTGKPIYLGETGENSNVWFRDAIRLFEDLGIGWAMWPVKKIESISGIMAIEKPEGYQEILDFYNGGSEQPSKDVAREALFQLARNTNMSNCEIHTDVIDAMTRQVYSKKTLPYKNHKIPGIIYASDFDYGQLHFAYYDDEYANYSVSSGNYTPWNNGWAYRNDGMDIEATDNNALNSNGYNLGWLRTGEWAQYTISDLTPGVYSIRARVASGGSGGFIRFMSGESGISERAFVGPTGGWDSWKNLKVENIVLTEDDKHLRFFIDKEGYNLASFEFIKEEVATSEVVSQFTFAKTIGEYQIEFNANKPFKSLGEANFSVYADGTELTVKSVQLNSENNRGIIVEVEEVLNYLQEISISFDGNNITCFDDSDLSEFTEEPVLNDLPRVFQIPGKIEAEDYDFQFGLALEECEDEGEGLNLSWLDPGDYAEYELNIPTAGKYNVEFRTAAEWADGKLTFELIEGEDVVFSETLSFTSTSGWQNWETTSNILDLPNGRYTLKLTILNSPYNINWFSITAPNSLRESQNADFFVFPNPASNKLFIGSQNKNVNKIEIIDIFGKQQLSIDINNLKSVAIDITTLAKGQYIIVTYDDSSSVSQSRFIKH